MMNMNKHFDQNCSVGIIGAGMFGFPFANYISDLNLPVILYDANSGIIEFIKNENHHPIHFTDIQMNSNVKLTNNLESLVEQSHILLMAVPSQIVRSASRDISKFVKDDKIILNLAKGIEISSGKRLSKVIHEEFIKKTKNNFSIDVAVLSGGMLANEFAYGEPLFADLACPNIFTANLLHSALSSQRLFLRPTKDIVGVEIAGAVKNVVAIAYGIGDALGYRISTLSGFITTASHEIIRLAYKLGANQRTFLSTSYSWNADLITTCLGNSRNKTFGQKIVELGSVDSAKQYMSEHNLTVEGVYTAEAFYQMSKQLGRNIPIIEEVYNIVYNNKNPKKSIQDLIDLALRK